MARNRTPLKKAEVAGATPVDETKVSWAEDDDDPDDAFFGRAN